MPAGWASAALFRALVIPSPDMGLVNPAESPTRRHRRVWIRRLISIGMGWAESLALVADPYRSSTVSLMCSMAER